MIDRRVVITGASGMIGRAIPFGTRFSKSELDINSANSIERVLDHECPEVILHLAGLDIRTVEARPLEGLKTNVRACRTLAQAARRRHIDLVFLSSGTIFWGEKGSVHYEDTEPAPGNLYGMMKLLAEEAIQDVLPRALIVRTGWVFGAHAAHHRKFVDVAIDRALAGQPIGVNRTQEGSPTYLQDLIETLADLINRRVSGVRHVVNSGVGTGADIAECIVQFTESSSTFVPEPGLGTIARSPSEVLASRHLTLRPWREALQEYVRQALAARHGVDQSNTVFSSEDPARSRRALLEPRHT